MSSATIPSIQLSPIDSLKRKSVCSIDNTLTKQLKTDIPSDINSINTTTTTTTTTTKNNNNNNHSLSKINSNNNITKHSILPQQNINTINKFSKAENILNKNISNEHTQKENKLNSENSLLNKAVKNNNCNNNNNTSIITTTTTTTASLLDQQQQKQQLHQLQFQQLLQQQQYKESITKIILSKTTTKPRFNTIIPEPVPIKNCEQCHKQLQHCKQCLDHALLCGNHKCNHRPKGSAFCVACKGLDEFHPICRSCTQYPPFTAKTNQCAHCQGYFCQYALSKPKLIYNCKKCEGILCWRCQWSHCINEEKKG